MHPKRPPIEIVGADNFTVTTAVNDKEIDSVSIDADNHTVLVTNNDDNTIEYELETDSDDSGTNSSSTDDSSTPDTPTPAKKSLTKATVKVGNKTYNGKAQKPAVKVTLDGKTLKNGIDYTVSYKSNKNCGKASVTVTGKGNYTGSKSASFIIKPGKVKAKKATSPKKKQVKITWKKSAGGVTGYQVQIALNKKFTKSAKTYTVKKAKTTSKTIKKLKSKKKYFVRMRAYKTVSGTKYYGAWSAVKSVKCK